MFCIISTICTHIHHPERLSKYNASNHRSFETISIALECIKATLSTLQSPHAQGEDKGQGGAHVRPIGRAEGRETAGASDSWRAGAGGRAGGLRGPGHIARAGGRGGGVREGGGAGQVRGLVRHDGEGGRHHEAAVAREHRQRRRGGRRRRRRRRGGPLGEVCVDGGGHGHDARGRHEGRGHGRGERREDYDDDLAAAAAAAAAVAVGRFGGYYWCGR